MSAQLLPISTSPNQSMRAILSVNGSLITLNLRVYYNQLVPAWMLDIADQFGNPMVSSIPLVTGVYPAANILGPYGYLGIGSAFVINQSGGTSDLPDDKNLGVLFQILWDDN